MVTLAGAGALLGGIGSLASGLGIGSKGTSRKRERDSARIAYEEALRYAPQEFQQKMDLAKQHGIHPLMMLGVGSPQVVQPSVVSSDRGMDFGSIAQGGVDIARALSGGTQTNMEKLQERLLAAQIEGQEIDNVSRASQIARVNAAGSPPAASNMASAKEKISRMDTPFGRTQGSFPLHKTAYDEEGNAVRFFNEEDLGDNDIAQIAHFLRYTVPDYWHSKVTRPIAPTARRGTDRIGWTKRGKRYFK